MIPTLDTDSFNGKVWLTADLHFGHEFILEVTDRPWKNIDRHDNALIRNANKLVKPKDLYIIVGDLTMKGSDRMKYIMRIVSRLPGNKILVFGNHDKLRPVKYVNIGFILAATSLVLPGGVLVVHDPAAATVWPKNKPVICGHIHELFKVIDNVVNVGIDVWDYKPTLLQHALAITKPGARGEIDWEKLSKDRHKT
jgi:calcineurin-like phosphoesterase family protein